MSNPTSRLTRSVPVFVGAFLLTALTGPDAPLEAQDPLTYPGGLEAVVGPNLRVAPGEFNEPWIAASSTNPDFLIAVTQRDAWSFATLSIAGERHNAAYLSRDGGASWEEIALPGYEPWSFDPMVVAGPDGRMWIMYTLIGRNAFGDLIPMENGRDDGAILVWSTDDEGLTWSDPAELRAPVPPDHPRIAVDWTDGPRRGRLYVVWNDVADSFESGEFQLFIHTVDDGGAKVSEPKLLAQIPDGKLVATEPVVLSDGTLLVTFYQYYFPLADAKNAEMPFFTMRSTDGGETFTDPEVAFRLGHHSWPYAMGEMSANFTLPIVTNDRTGGPNRDNVYVAWDAVTDGVSDIWFRRSTDRGRRWSDPLRLNDNVRASADAPLDDRMIPVIDVNADGVIGATWYDRRGDETRRCWELYFAASLDGGSSFGPNVRVSTKPSCQPDGRPPTVRAHNVAADPSVTDVPPEALAEMSLLERSAVATVQEVRRAQAEYFADAEHGRLEVTFDGSRGVLPGHYIGLSADAEGAFHALWINRRNALDELFSAEISLEAALAAPGGPATDLTGLLLVVPGAVTYDPASGAVGIEVQIRNVSDATVRGPVVLRSTSGDQEWSFEGHMGSHDRLEPGQISEPLRIDVRLAADGVDLALDFQVWGRDGG